MAGISEASLAEGLRLAERPSKEQEVRHVSQAVWLEARLVISGFAPRTLAF